jgi:hypothetical protein
LLEQNEQRGLPATPDSSDNLDDMFVAITNQPIQIFFTFNHRELPLFLTAYYIQKRSKNQYFLESNPKTDEKQILFGYESKKYLFAAILYAFDRCRREIGGFLQCSFQKPPMMQVRFDL